MSDTPQTPFQRAQGYEAKGDWLRAADHYEAVIKLTPDFVGALHNLGQVYRRLDRLDDAITVATEAMRLAPEHATIRLSLGDSLAQSKRPDEAIFQYHEALRLRPDYIAAMINLGVLLEQTDRPDQATEILERAQELDSEHDGVRLNLANAYLGIGRPDDASTLLKALLADDPHSASAHNSLGTAHYIRRDWTAAVDSFRSAIAHQADFAQAHENLAQALMQMGDFDNAWPEYDWRWRNPDNFLTKRFMDRPLWDGSSLSGRTIFLHGEQGYGDTIQFIRYVKFIDKTGGGRIILACQKELIPLLTTLPEIDEICILGGELPGFDCQSPLMTLPRLISTDSIDHRPYLSAVPADRTQINSGVLNIGIAWAGRPRHEMDPHRNRSCAVDLFAPLVKQPNHRLFSLQPGSHSADLSRIGISDLSAKIEHFGDTAALVAEMDLIITVDTALAHLAGAMGKPGFVLLAYSADWRWRQAPGTTSWYDSLRVFQQSSPGDWTSLFTQVLEALEALK